MNTAKSLLQLCGIIAFGLIFSVLISFIVCFKIANLLGFSGLLFGLLGIVMGMYLFFEASKNLYRNEKGLWVIDHCSRAEYYKSLNRQTTYYNLLKKQ